MVVLEIPGEPVAKGRPKFSRRGAFVKAYTPEKTLRYEDTVRVIALNAGVEPMEGPLVLDIEAVWPTKGAPLKRGSRPSVPKATRPDADNVAKAILDAGNGILWHDDGQVVDLRVRKRHAAQGEDAHTTIRLGALAE